MDFARKQLEKYGWTDGKGLGKHEDGISQALRPKIKRSVTGVGHDPAADFNEHWWSALYDRAAKNVEVEEENGKTKKIKTILSDEFQITNNTWKLNKKQIKNNDEQYSDHFVRTAVMSGGSKTEIVRSESESEIEDRKDVVQMTDEELFKACEGRTAHKGARHGLKAIGKLARIQQQEQVLLTLPKYAGYSHAKKIKQKDQDTETVVEEITFNSEEVKDRKKKKKKKRCFLEAAQEMQPLPKNLQIDDENMVVDGDASDENADSLVENCDKVRKSKKEKRKMEFEVTENKCESELDEKVDKKKKKKKKERLKEID